MRHHDEKAGDEIETHLANAKGYMWNGNFQTYIANNAGTIPNYAERYRYGERVSTDFVESAANTVVDKRFG